MDALDLLDSGNFITVNKSLIKELGLYEAIMLGELAGKYRYWKTANKLDEEGYFFISHDDIKEETGLTKYYQNKALEHLYELGIIKVKHLNSTNRSNCYKIVTDALANMLTLDWQTGCRSNDNHVDTTNTSYTNTLSTNTSYIPEQAPVFQDTSVKGCKALLKTIYNLPCSNDMKESLKKWYMNVVKNQISIQQFLDTLNNLAVETNNNESLMIPRIENAYIKNWHQFYPISSYNKQKSNNDLCFNKHNIETYAERPAVQLGDEEF